MERKNLIRKIAAGIFFAAGLFFALYFSVLTALQTIYLDVSGLVTVTLFVCVPLAFGACFLVAAVSGLQNKQKAVRIILFAVFAFYCVVLIALLFLGALRQPRSLGGISLSDYLKWNTNLVPFKTVANYFRALANGRINTSTVIENLAGNLLVFAPMGFLLPCLFKKLRKFGWLLLTALLMLVAVEVLQLFTYTGSCDVDDVLLNLFGLLLFYGVWHIKPVQKGLRRIYILK